MRLPLWVLRWMHRRRLSRRAMRGGLLHSWFGERLLNKALWRPTKESLARAWLVGFPISILPIPGQILATCCAAVLVRANVLLCVGLTFLTTPLTAPLHLTSCYVVGEALQGRNPAMVWREASKHPRQLLSGKTVFSVYLGAVVIGVVGGVAGYGVLHHTWKEPQRRTWPGRTVRGPGQLPS